MKFAARHSWVVVLMWVLSTLRLPLFRRAWMAVFAAVFCCVPVFAETRTWTGQAGFPFPSNDLWSNAFNWSPAGIPPSSDTTDLVFGASPRLSPFQNVADPFVARSLTFSVPGYNLSGFPIATSLIHND